MSASSRRHDILNRLFTEGYVDARQLAHDLDVDASTIRRDLMALEEAGQVQRTHGGARPAPGAIAELPYAMKRAENLPEKTAIAAAAARNVRDGDTVVLDSGSTTYEVAAALTHCDGLTVITNDLRIAKFVAALPRFRLLVTGGELLGSVFTLVGARAVDFLHDYHADWCFLGADAVDIDAGITNTNTSELPVKRAMLAIAHTSIAVADHSKIGRRTLARVAGIDEIDTIITDNAVPADLAHPYGSKLIRAELRADTSIHPEAEPPTRDNLSRRNLSTGS